jgi:hypothetical protein
MKNLKSFKLFENETYYSDDINVQITSNVIDILQDLIDDGLNIKCFTVGHIIKKSGVYQTDNDIVLYIKSNHYYDIIYKTLDFKLLKPYLKRVCDYMESEDRHYEVNVEYRAQRFKYLDIPNTNRTLLLGLANRIQDITDIDDIDEEISYESIEIRFKLY